MSGTKDPAIKLFGKTIPLPSNEEIHGDRGGGEGDGDVVIEESSDFSSIDEKKLKQEGEELTEEDEDPSSKRPTDIKVQEGSQPLVSEELADATSSGNNENPKTPSYENEVGVTKDDRNEEEQSDTSSSQEKSILKKPDKILPCPRCNSMDTKFCYYNNYNVNQPRHFCKNCQRYWTAGGTMRNVPVGAGRRKNKNSVSHYRHITVSEALQAPRPDAPNGIHHPTVKPNGTILTFGSDAPLCESMASVLSLAEKTMRNGTRNGFHKQEEQKIPVSSGGESGDENSMRSSVTATSSTEEGRRVGLPESSMQNMNGFPPQIPCFPGAPWPYPWNSAVPPPSFCPSNFPISFFPAPTYWGCPIPGAWSIPWMAPPQSSPNSGAPSSGPNSPHLGKHSREGDMLKTNTSENVDLPKHSNSAGGVWIPKTLRIDDPGEAAKSSIWATLGIKNDNSDPMNGGRIFKAFQSKGDEKNHMDENSQVLHANPAALSRSLNFHESA
ncbi:hypothetical protein AQUCO_00200633v1 [Aquilegia coerulea]|uniref:Dof-type domain-containing protein n=1 Tax=Aquilegia coerulea TaxID=218851 RepID=A0A2G5F412_AQUCA|nr:hypothetical protein AQUCO_00200633v1 [Aquilegia coerulea]